MFVNGNYIHMGPNYMKTYNARIRMKQSNGLYSFINTTVNADNTHSARALLKAQYSDAVIENVIEVEQDKSDGKTASIDNRLRSAVWVFISIIVVINILIYVLGGVIGNFAQIKRPGNSNSNFNYSESNSSYEDITPPAPPINNHDPIKNAQDVYR